MAIRYKEIYDDIVLKIKTGQLSVGQKLKTEYELMEDYSCSRQTIRNALKMLEDNNIILKKQGSGSYINSVSFAKKHYLIAVIMTFIDEGVFPSILKGIDSVFSRGPYTLLLNSTKNGFTKEKEILEALSSMDIDGIIVEGSKTAIPNPNLNYYRNFLNKNIPVVFFNRVYFDLFKEEKRSNLTYVNVDEELAAYNQTKDLIKLGYKKIGGIFKSDDIIGLQRYSGTIKALIEANIAINDENFIWITTQTWPNTDSLIINSNINNCDAAICFTDSIAKKLIKVCIESNSSIRAIRSFDNFLTDTPRWIDFKSVSWKTFNIGEVVAKKMINLINGVEEEAETLQYKQ